MRVRFAPSPTGFLHVGGARTALFNWLLARRSGGTFVLRIEDTDRARSSEAMTAAIQHGLGWLGIDWDEGPFFQSDRVGEHTAAGRKLLAGGHAYRDFSTPEELARDRANIAALAGEATRANLFVQTPQGGDRRAGRSTGVPPGFVAESRRALHLRTHPAAIGAS